MKLFHIFKKESSKEVKSNIQKMDKNQLSKVIGGGGPDIPDEIQGPVNTTRSKIKTPS